MELHEYGFELIQNIQKNHKIHYHIKKIIPNWFKTLFWREWVCNTCHCTFRSYFEMPKSPYWIIIFLLKLGICLIFSLEIWVQFLFSAFFHESGTPWKSFFHLWVTYYKVVILRCHYHNKCHCIRFFCVFIIEYITETHALKV